MKLRCTYKPGVAVPDPLIRLGYSQQTVFNVTWDRVYVVYAICVWKKEILYLLLNDETQRPDWFPAFCFEVVDSRLPPTWHFGYWGNDPGAHVTAIWGYAELASDGGKHYVALIEREPKAMEVFKTRQNEIDSAE